MTIAVCPACDSAALEGFHQADGVPTNSCLLLDDELDARAFPKARLDLAVCHDCGFIMNRAFDAERAEYSARYEETQAFSPTFVDFGRGLAKSWVDDHDLHGKHVLEIGCGKGEFLIWMIEAGVGSGTGIDPGVHPERLQGDAAAEIEWIADAERLVAEGKRADVIIANNVMAHIPDLNGFVAGMAVLLADDGLITVENPYVRDLIEHGEFDTIYHEHFFYHSCTSVDALVRRHGLRLNDVEYFPDLHGGTLRWHISKRDGMSATVQAYLADERARGMTDYDYYERFADRVDSIKSELIELLEGLRADGQTIAAYGAAAKGSTLINYVGIDPGLVDFVVDRNSHKHGLLMPGMHLPILPVEALLEQQPDYVLILAWNFAREIVDQQQEYLARGGHFIVPVPRPEVIA